MKRTVNPLYLSIGNRLANLRRKKRLSQAALSESLNITVKHLSECERGLTTLSLDKRVCEEKSVNSDLL